MKKRRRGKCVWRAGREDHSLIRNLEADGSLRDRWDLHLIKKMKHCAAKKHCFNVFYVVFRVVFLVN